MLLGQATALGQHGSVWHTQPLPLQESEAHVSHSGSHVLMGERELLLGCPFMICTYTTFSPMTMTLLLWAGFCFPASLN